MYGQKDHDNIKCLAYIADSAHELENTLDNQISQTDDLIRKVEILLRDNDNKQKIIKSGTITPYKFKEDLKPETYEDILEKANRRYGQETEFNFEDILSAEEIASAYKRVDQINYEFSKATKLNKVDICFLILATALQTIKSFLVPVIGKSFNPDNRLDHNDPFIEREHRQGLDNFRDAHYPNDWNPVNEDGRRKSWIEILYTKAPYDKIKGSAALGLDLTGKNHRLKTLGHDPILGWVFGTMNIMTNTATLSNFDSYRIVSAHWTCEQVPLSQIFSEAIEMTRYDWHTLAAALVAQGLHLKSDEYTKMGLPVPCLQTINEDWASKLYNEHYDKLCLQRDLKIIAKSALVSIFINMLISFVHGMFYDPVKHGPKRELYEVKTRKILCISNTLASASNVIYACITKNPGKLDIGGLLVTLSRLFMDIRFIARIKEEYIQGELDKDLNNSLKKLDELEKEILGR